MRTRAGLVGGHGGCQGAVALGDVALAVGAACLRDAPHSQPRGREQQGQQQLQALLPGPVQVGLLEPAAHQQSSGKARAQGPPRVPCLSGACSLLLSARDLLLLRQRSAWALSLLSKSPCLLQ